MKKKFLNYSKSLIIKYNHEYSTEDMERIIYGLEVVYLTITKTLILLPVAYFLGLFKEVMIFTFFFGLLRCFTYGIHASKSSTCLVTSSITFLGAAYLSNNIILSNFVLGIGAIIFLTLFYLYAPADTENKPLVNRKKRHFSKVGALFITCIYIFCFFILGNVIIINLLFLSLFTAALMILPITYKLANAKYNNYKSYTAIKSRA